MKQSLFLFLVISPKCLVFAYAGISCSHVRMGGGPSERLEKMASATGERPWPLEFSSLQRLQAPRTRTRFRPGESETDGPTRDAWQATHADMPSLSPSRRPPSALECATLCSATTPNSLFTWSRSRKSHNLNEALGPAFWTRVGPGLVIVFSLGLPGFWGRAHQLHRQGLGLVAWMLLSLW